MENKIDKQWTMVDIKKAMKNEFSEKQLNHINNKKNEVQKKQRSQELTKGE